VKLLASGNTEVTNDRATGLAFKEYVEFLARWPKVTNLIPERAFFSSLDASSSRLAHSCLGLRAVRSPVGRPRIRRRFSGDGRSNPVGGNAGRAEVHCLESDQRKCAFLRGVARATDAPARMAVVSKCSILAGCHLWTQSPLGHVPPCLVSLNLPMNCLCSARSEIYRGDDRRQHRLKPTFSVASQFQFKSFRNNFDPDARI
jgi:hypothetical protein